MQKIKKKATENTDVPGGKVLDWLILQFRQHPKSAVLTTSMLWGGMIILLHFYRIGYLPILALPDLFGVVLSAAAMGALLVLSVCFIMLIPGLALVHWARCGMGPRKNSVVREGKRPVFHWRYQNFALCTVAGAVAAALIYGALFASFDVWLEAVPWLITALVTAAGLCVGLIWVVADTDFGKRWVVDPSRCWWKFLLLQVLSYFFWWAYAALMLLFWANRTGWDMALNVVILLVLSVFLHLLMLAVSKRSARTKAVAVLGIVCYFTLATNSLTSWQSRIVAHFDLGEVSHVNLILDRTGCDAVNSAWSKRPCVVVQGGSPQAYLLYDVDLITRVGPFYVVGESGAVNDLEDRRLLRVAIKGDNVLGWSRIRSEKSPK
ncbi:hypothetical protein [Lysobacter enzymogenes]|uniref:Uncharacterized protein n=2 Tax=Bacteria TaxID=2 RepID=A0AAU9ACH6_LYSEN|nr:hypothetical protein [Lysobacter enzymogenes]BAV95792.1 conserved hypothetical protein [Lysobacter enzymogenes]